MSNNPEQVDFTSADIAVKKSIHPEVERRNKEIAEIHRNLTSDEKFEVTWQLAEKKWHNERNQNKEL